MLPFKILLYLVVGISFVVADERIGEIAEDSTYYRSSQNPNRGQLQRTIQPVHRIPRPMPRPTFIAAIEPESVPTVAEVPYSVLPQKPDPVGVNPPYRQPNFSFTRPSLGSRPITDKTPSYYVPLPEKPLNRPSNDIPNRPQLGWTARQPVYPKASIPTNIVDQAPIEEQKEASDSWSSSLSHRPFLSARPIPPPYTAGVSESSLVVTESIPPPYTAGVIESSSVVTESVSIPEPDISALITENIVEEQNDVVTTSRPETIIPAVIPSSSKPYYQRPILSARPIPRPISYGVVTPKIELPPVTEPSTERANPEPTEVPISTSLPKETEIEPEISTIPKGTAIISPVTPLYSVNLPAIPTVWRPYQRPTISARPIPRPMFNGIITTQQPIPQGTEPFEPMTSPSSIVFEPQPTTELVPPPSSKPEPIEPLASSTTAPIKTNSPVETLVPAEPLIPEVIPEPVITEKVPSSTASPDVSISPDRLVIIPHPVPRPRPVNVENWTPSPKPSVPVQPLPVKKPLVPLGRYPPTQVQPNNDIVSNVVAVTNKPTPKPTLKPKPIPTTSPTFSVIPGNVINMRCESENGYFARQECDSFIECKRNVATENLCPDGLHFNPNTVWPEYPCAYPSEVQCIGRPLYQQANPTSECPRQYGFFPMGGDCSKYLMCQEGIATIMRCPPGLVYNPTISGCDWPEQVPSCKPEVFQGFTCPPVPLDEDPDIIIKYKYGNSCKNYVACQRGSPRLLSCDEGFSFDMNSGYCIESDYVENCASFV